MALFKTAGKFTELDTTISKSIYFRTRWNTLYDMLNRFIALEKIINNTLIHLNLRSLILNEEELTSVKNLVEALKPIEKGSRKLGHRKVTLGKADQFLELMLAKLYKLTTPIGRQLYASVESRIKERRNKKAATLQAFLEDHEFLDELEQGSFKMLGYADRTEVVELACYLYKRLFGSEDSEVEMVDDNPDNPGMQDLNYALTLSA